MSSTPDATRTTAAHVYSIVSLERTGSQQHFHNLSTPACSVPCSGLLSNDARLVLYVVGCLTAGAKTPSHAAAVVSGWSDSRVSAFLHLARQRACWWVCAVARFCLDRMEACDWVSWIWCLRHVAGWVGGVIFARRRPQKNLATRSLECGRVAWTLAHIGSSSLRVPGCLRLGKCLRSTSVGGCGFSCSCFA